jgi:hypothetical protein
MLFGNDKIGKDYWITYRLSSASWASISWLWAKRIRLDSFASNSSSWSWVSVKLLRATLMYWSFDRKYSMSCCKKRSVRVGKNRGGIIKQKQRTYANLFWCKFQVTLECFGDGLLLLCVHRHGDKTPNVESGFNEVRIIGEGISDSHDPFCAKPALRVGPYFHILAIFKSL